MEKTIEAQKIQSSADSLAWRWMRYSGLLLIPLAWGHVLIQDVLVGVHHIDLTYVAFRWASVGWRTYDFFLLAFTFAHGVNGLRQVLNDYLQNEQTINRVGWALFAFWLIISIIGAIAIIGGVR